jgi:hypothetical protein
LLRGLYHTVDGPYLIESVTYEEDFGAYVATLDRYFSAVYESFLIPILGTGTDPLEESSEVEFYDGFDGYDVDLWLTITGSGANEWGSAFYLGEYNIDSVDSGTATVGPTSGTEATYIGHEGSTSGVGYFTGMTGGTGYIKKPLVCKTNGWSGPAGTEVTIVWNEDGDDLLLDDAPDNDSSHEEDYYQIVREYPINSPTVSQVLVSVDGVVFWDAGDDDWSCT